MEQNLKNGEFAIHISGVKKMYKLGQIGGGTLQADLQSWWARKRGKADPNTKIGQEDQARLVGQTFMALNGIDLTVYKGEALGIIGGNGAGKSTLLKLLSQVTAPTDGKIELWGRVASMLEVGTGFNGEMTGRENVYMNGAILGMSKAEIDAKMEDIIEFSEVRDFIDTPVKRYSSGMYVKLAFSVAAHLDSEIMIMDEVLAVGDMAFQNKCLDKMRDVANKDGRTVLYVSHNMNTIRQLCDRCVVLDKGKVIYIGDVETAIGYYMNTANEALNVNIDLSNKRMKHLPADIQAKMTNIQLLNKTIAVYEVDEPIDLILSVKTNKAINSLCCRMEIRSADGSYVGTTMIHDFAKSMKDELIVAQLQLNLKGLVKGKYSVLAVLYEATETGAYNDLDAVKQAFCFEVRDTYNALKLVWNDVSWGKIKFEDILLRNLQIQ